MVTTGADRKARDMLAISVTKLPLWLATHNARFIR